ncbi:MAG: HAD-IA family hydrolase, partial [Planctomycetota bacterium]
HKKLEGDANNDWLFSHRLLSENGIGIDFETVKQRFEDIYQGENGFDGVWDREICLVNRDWLVKLAERMPLGIVTGRPRNDAIRFLQNEKIEHLFESIVCMEDGPRKPDPSNVLTAMKNMDVSRAWMIGDTPDDMGAACSAEVIPIGKVAPNDEIEFSSEQLTRSGACEIVSTLEQLGEMLP